MADNSTQGGTDTIRDLDRAAGGVKTQVFQLDLGGGSGNAEVLIIAGQKAMAASVPVVMASDQSDLPMGTDISTPTAMPAGGVGVRGWLSAIWTKLNGSLAVTGTFWQTTQPVSGTVTAARPTTGTRTSVAAAAADTALLAANAARFGATVHNDDTKDLYLALGTAAASVTSFTQKVAPGGYYETPFGYSGAVRGIWAASPTGSARITEIT